MILFDKLWDTMREKGISTYTLREKYNIDTRTIRRLKANANTTTDTLNALFALLIDDALEYSPNSAIEYSGAISIFTDLILNPIITHANSNIDVRGVHNDKFDAQKIALLGLRPKLKTSVVPADDIAAVKLLVREYHTMKKECSQYIRQWTASF